LEDVCVGMGLCIRSGSVADGIEILALLTTRKIGLNVSEVLASIVLFFYPLLGSLVLVLYSIVTYFSAVKSLDYVTNGIEHYTSLHIISAKAKKLNFNFE
jgi:uncharacterized membrane-anchored protein YitT (DUF2179 family)